MSRRSRDWNERLAKDLRDPEFAQAFVMGLIDEGFDLKQALAKVIRAYGVKEFAAHVRMPASNLSRVIREDYNPTLNLLERLLASLGMKPTATPLEKLRKGKVA